MADANGVEPKGHAVPLVPQVLEDLRVEALTLSLEARTYCLDRDARERDSLSPVEQLALNCRMLRITARLSEIVAWILARMADYEEKAAGSLVPAFRPWHLNPSLLRPDDPATDPATAQLTDHELNEFERLNTKSLTLYRRVYRLEEIVTARS